MQFTSGSTAMPRAIVVTAANLEHNTAAIAAARNLGAGDRAMSWLPLYHDMGLIVFLLLPLLADIDLDLADPSRWVTEPRRWLRWLHESRATITCGPQSAYSALTRRRIDAEGIDLRSLRHALNGAEPIDPAAMRAFGSAAASIGFDLGTLGCGYGLAEATVGVSLGRPGDGLRTVSVDRDDFERGAVRPSASGSLELAVLGPPLPGIEVRCTVDGRLATDDEVGEVEVRGPSVARAHPASDEGLAVDADGWLPTGDLGFLAEGQLVVCGRRKEIIILHGRNLAPHLVEAAVQNVAGVRAGHVAAFGVPVPARGTQGLVLAVESHDGDPAVRTAVRDAVKDAIGIAPLDVVVLPAGELPNTTSGKIQRRECAARYERGILS